jgi:hypothetical protein
MMISMSKTPGWWTAHELQHNILHYSFDKVMLPPTAM